MKYCVFSKNSQKFATSPSPALGCYWLYKKLPANNSDCTLALRWELWRSLTAIWAREGLQWVVKKHNFYWTPFTYIYLKLHIYILKHIFSVYFPHTLIFLLYTKLPYIDVCLFGTYFVSSYCFVFFTEKYINLSNHLSTIYLSICLSI